MGGADYVTGAVDGDAQPDTRATDPVTETWVPPATLTTLQWDARLFGLVDTRSWPVESTATHNEIAGQARSVSDAPSSRAPGLHLSGTDAAAVALPAHAAPTAAAITASRGNDTLKRIHR
jgi:hypothetical protein